MARRQYIKTAATDGRINRNSYWHAPAPTAHSTSLTHPDENASLYRHFNVALPPYQQNCTTCCLRVAIISSIHVRGTQRPTLKCGHRDARLICGCLAACAKDMRLSLAAPVSELRLFLPSTAYSRTQRGRPAKHTLWHVIRSGGRLSRRPPYGLELPRQPLPPRAAGGGGDGGADPSK